MDSQGGGNVCFCPVMDKLRYHLYHHSKKTIVDLPPTSCSGRGHILQAFYGTYLQLHCLDDAELNPCEFGFYQDDGALLPDIKQALLPDDFPMPCRCTASATKRCPCRQNEIKYCSYCSCQAVETQYQRDVDLPVSVSVNRLHVTAPIPWPLYSAHYLYRCKG